VKHLRAMLLVLAVALGLTGGEMARAVLADREVGSGRVVSAAGAGGACTCHEPGGEGDEPCPCGPGTCDDREVCPCMPSGGGGGPRVPTGGGAGAVHLAVVAGQARVQREARHQADGVRHRPALWAAIAAAGRVERGRAALVDVGVEMGGEGDDGGGRGVLRRAGVLRL
jgi:hypothetical protein